ncbi:MAG: reverse transcriptase domain-containing protein, partial [Bacteroidota bacterium]
MANPSPDFPKRSREELRKLIQQTSREEFILDEMQRYGLWPAEEAMPTLEEDLIRKESTLQKDLNALLRQQRQQENTKAMLRKMRKERMAAAKQKRAATKAKRVAEKQARAAAWAQKKATDIEYLGEEVSSGLHNKTTDKAKLQAKGLPIFETIEQLAAAMELRVGQLRWLAFNRKVSTTSHYQRFEIPKKNGSVRVISAPRYLLKSAQHWILEQILYKHPIEQEAHGFVPQKSIVSNAQIHVGQSLLINADMKDFFPSISYRRIKGMFHKMGYSEQIATIFALLCSEPETDEVALDGVTYYVQTGERNLPQGAPTSPAITNIICRRLDRRMAGTAKRLDFRYSRYADDLSFSTSELA